MAITVKPKAVVTFDIEPAASQETRIAEARERRFIDNERATVDSIMAIYEDNREKLARATDDDQVMLLSTLHAQREFMGWFIGEALLSIEQQIVENRKAGYSTLSEWINRNEDRLGFGRSAAYNYRTIREASTIEQFQKLGVKKVLVVAQLKDEKKREQAYKVITEKKMTAEAAKEYVQEIQERERDKFRRVVEEKKTEAKSEVRLDVVADARGVVLKTSREYADALIAIFSSPSEIERLKIKIYDKKQADA